MENDHITPMMMRSRLNRRLDYLVESWLVYDQTLIKKRRNQSGYKLSHCNEASGKMDGNHTPKRNRRMFTLCSHLSAIKKRGLTVF